MTRIPLGFFAGSREFYYKIYWEGKNTSNSQKNFNKEDRDVEVSPSSY